MRVVFAGTPEVALPSLEAIAASPHELVGVITRPDARAGRGRTLVASPVAQRAAQLGVPVLKPQHPRDPEFQDRLRGLEPDCCPVVAYGALLPESALAIPRHGWVNLHFSLLPRWRGAAPVQHALLHGDDYTGATTFRIVAGLDEGPTYGIMTERVHDDDTAGTLLTRLAEGGADLLVATLDGIESGEIEERPQPADGITYAGKVTVEDARVRWDEPVAFVDRRIRACTPAPGAWTTYAGERLKLGPVARDPEHPALGPGAIAVSKHAVHVGTRTAAVRLGEVTPFGKKPMDAADWARGVRLETGARLGDEEPDR
ncbi:MAG: methionyl-tRNA formyltransferase [Nocardioidaceae bacterium]